MDKVFDDSRPYIFRREGKPDTWKLVEKAYEDEVELHESGDWPPYDDTDMVNSPPHYTAGRFEAIDVIEDAIREAPSTKAALHQAQALKYLLRLWHKSNDLEDAKKARWYLNRLIDSL